MTSRWQDDPDIQAALETCLHFLEALNPAMKEPA